MAANRYAGIARGFMLATALSVTLGGCVSAEYQKVADRKSKRGGVPMANSTSATADVMPVTGTVKPVTMASNSANTGLEVPPVMSVQATQNTLLNATPASGIGSPSTILPGPQQVASAGFTDPLATTASDSGIELAFAPPAHVTVPLPRPDIIAAANSLPMPTGADEVKSAAIAGTEPGNSAVKDVENLEQRLASADPAPDNMNPLTFIAIPTPRPGPNSMGLEAYANTPSMMALDAFDTSSPEKFEATPLAPNDKLQSLIKKYAELYQVPEALVHRVVKRESNYNPAAYSLGNYGLMQIRYNTARGLGYTGSPTGLFDAETNLKYAVKYLRGAFMVAENNHDNAVRLYARGYYYDAKRKGMLHLLQ